MFTSANILQPTLSKEHCFVSMYDYGKCYHLSIYLHNTEHKNLCSILMDDINSRYIYVVDKCGNRIHQYKITHFRSVNSSVKCMMQFNIKKNSIPDIILNSFDLNQSNVSEKFALSINYVTTQVFIYLTPNHVH